MNRRSLKQFHRWVLMHGLYPSRDPSLESTGCQANSTPRLNEAGAGMKKGTPATRQPAGPTRVSNVSSRPIYLKINDLKRLSTKESRDL
jgi:hypothetical protein